jgi:putative Mg2+ transporter-C (MgtC) family protein
MKRLILSYLFLTVCLIHALAQTLPGTDPSIRHPIPQTSHRMKNYQLSPLETVARLALAAVMGSVIGWERQRKEGAAGLRTHMMVCLGSALVMIVSAFGFEDILGRPDVVLDPSRIAAQVISGIGFLGAGTIVFLRPQVIRGLTTAAGLWTVAAIGLAVGGGLYLAAIATTVIALLILAVIKPLEHRMMERRRKRKGTPPDEEP